MRTALITALALFVVGCSNTLETGYKPRVLGASAAERRAYYAKPFTPEKKAGQVDRDSEAELRRPRPGY